jgi:hypothetical protein
MSSLRDRLTVLVGMCAFFAASCQAQDMPVTNGLPPTTELVPWIVGADLTLMLGLHANGKPTPKDDYKYQRVKSILEHLGIEMPKLPTSETERAKESAQALRLLIGEFGAEVTQTLQVKYDAKHCHLLEVAIKSGSLLVLYAPGDDLGMTIVSVMEDRAGKAGLPEKLWRPLVEKIKAKAQAQEVVAAVLEFQGAVETHLEENGTLMPGRELLTAYELGFHWGMVADAFIFKSDLIKAEFQPRASRNARALAIDLTQHEMRVGLLGRKDDVEGRRWVAEFRQRSIIGAVEKKLDSRAGALFRLASELQILRGEYDPEAVFLTQSAVESSSVVFRKLAQEADLLGSIFDPLDAIGKSLVSKDQFNETIFRINGEILNELRERTESKLMDATAKHKGPAAVRSSPDDMELLRRAAEATNGIKNPASSGGLKRPAQVSPLIQQQIKSALQVHVELGGKIPQTTDEFMKRIVQFSAIQLPPLRPGERFKWDLFSQQLTVEVDK